MSEQNESLYKLQKKDIPTAVSVAAAAFRTDPFWGALFGKNARPEQTYNIFESLIRYCFKYGEVYAPSASLEGVAAWVHSDFADMTFGRMVASGMLAAILKVGIGNVIKVMPALDAMDVDRVKNMKGKSYFYLHTLCVAPELQGKGLGGKLLRAVIEKSEQAGVYIYLETQTESNLSMYEKFGFELVQKQIVPKTDLPVWELMRKPGR